MCFWELLYTISTAEIKSVVIVLSYDTNGFSEEIMLDFESFYVCWWRFYFDKLCCAVDTRATLSGQGILLPDSAALTRCA